LYPQAEPKGYAKPVIQKIDQSIRPNWQGGRVSLAAGGQTAVVRNGYLPECDIQTGIGPLKVRIPESKYPDTAKGLGRNGGLL